MNDDGFPFRESHTDFAGEVHNFIISETRHVGPGKVVVAHEEDREWGYELSACSPNDAYQALGKVRGKIRMALSTKYIDHTNDSLTLTHEKIVGKIAHLGIVVNGQLVDFSELEKILTTYEGFDIEINIKDSYE